MSYEPQTRESLEDSLIASRDMAKLAYGQFEAFVEAGFNDAQALHLLGVWLAEVVGGGS